MVGDARRWGEKVRPNGLYLGNWQSEWEIFGKYWENDIDLLGLGIHNVQTYFLFLGRFWGWLILPMMDPKFDMTKRWGTSSRSIHRYIRLSDAVSRVPSSNQDS